MPILFNKTGLIRKYYCRRNWYPEGMKLLRGKANEDKASTHTHGLGEKTIADVCEALIGASLLSGGPVNRFDMAVKAVTILVNSELHDVENWADYFSRYSLPLYQIKEADGFEKDLAKQIDKKLGYRFNYPRLLRSAFTHPSFPSAWSTVPCYQRLEFLGDSLLDMVCVEDLYERFPDRDPQWLTEHKVSFEPMPFMFNSADITTCRWLWCPTNSSVVWLSASTCTLTYSTSATNFRHRLLKQSRIRSSLMKVINPWIFGS